MKRVQTAKLIYIITSAAVILIGCLFLFRPETLLVTLSRAVGIVFMASGLARLFGYFSNDTHQLAFQFDLALGALTALFGLVVLIFPEHFAEYLTSLISVFVIIDALFTLQNAIDAKKFGIGKWWLILVGAIAAFAVGAIMLFRPIEANVLFLRIVGVALILDGVQNIIVAFITIYRTNKHD